jgi:hypothetical protein
MWRLCGVEMEIHCGGNQHKPHSAPALMPTMAARAVMEQEQRFMDLVLQNSSNAAILARLPHLELPGACLTGGCLFQTVWNVLSQRAAFADILDYDIFYFDDTDLSWEAEDAAIRRVSRALADAGVQVQVRNQARVHLWYEHRFGAPCEPLRSALDGIDHFLNQSSCFGIRSADSGLEVYAPFGFDDLFSMTVRPNRRRNLPTVYHEKAARWSAAWKGLKVLPWADTK